QGRSKEEAALQIGCPAGTLRSRLSRGLEKLRANLLRRGIGTSAGVLGTVLTANVSASAMASAVPAGVASSTVKAGLLFAAGKAAAVAGVSIKVVALAERVLKAMLISKLVKTCAVVFVTVALIGTVGLVNTMRGQGSGPAPQSKPEEKPRDKPDAGAA